MEFMRLQVCCVFVTVFVGLFCADLANRVEGDIRLANIGDNITLRCYRPDGIVDNYKRWYRNGTLIANREGVFINDSRFKQGVSQYGYPDSNNISISNIRMNDSATFKCIDFYNNTLQSYDLRVIRCSCIITTHSNPDKMKVMCTLDNYWTGQTLSRNISLDGNKVYRTTVIQERTFSFSTYVTQSNRLRSIFYLHIEPESRITCMLSTQPTPPSPPTTTLPTTSLKQTTQIEAESRITCMLTTQPTPPSSPTTTATLPTTSVKQTMQNRSLTLSYTASQTLPAGRSTSISATQDHTPKTKNANSDKNTGVGNITLIIVILGSAFILILIVIIIVLRRKQMSDRQENKHIRNASIKKEHPEVCYESVEDGSRKGPEYATSIKELKGTSLDQRSADHPESGELIYNILYDCRDKIAESSIARIEGPLDNALYAMPDKRVTISRETKPTSKVTVRSSNSDHLYGNSAIITQHEQNRDTLQQVDQYEHVKMPGSGGDAEEIPLYDMPDRGPTRNTLKATPEAGQASTLPKDEVVGVDALYAEVDKTKKK